MMTRIGSTPFVFLVGVHLLLLCLYSTVTSVPVAESSSDPTSALPPIVKRKVKMTDDQKKARRAVKEKLVADLNAQSGGRITYKVHDAFVEMDDEAIQAMHGAKREGHQNHGERTQKRGRPELRHVGEVDPVLVHGNAGRSKRGTVTCSNYNFDSRNTWPKCANIINNVRDQSGCGSCWAVASASAFTDRMCVTYTQAGYLQANDPNQAGNFASALDIMQCSGGASGDACQGGLIGSAWKYLVWNGNGATSGVVSGQNNTYGGCKPYPYPPLSSTSYSCPTTCSTACTNPQWPDSYTGDKVTATNYTSLYEPTYSPSKSLENDMLWAIHDGGSITVFIEVYPDFQSYHSGIYTHNPASGGTPGGHAVRLFGWGTYNCSDGSSTDYWMGYNSWNTWWGQNGFFQIRRGTNEVTIEQGPVGWGTPW